MFVLELVEAFLPASIALDLDLDTTKDDFFAALEINAELDDITVIDWIWPALNARTAQADVIQKGAGAALTIFDVPLVVGTPKFAMVSAHNLALKANGGDSASRAGTMVVSLRVATNSDDA